MRANPVTIAGVRLPNKFMNGAYINSKTLDDVEILSNSAAGTVVVGSITVKYRESNDVSGFWVHSEQQYTMNSFGMPNGGLIDYKDTLPKMVRLAHKAGKKLIANITPFSHREFAQLMELAQTSKADMVELNLGCPNVWEDGVQEQIPSYHPSQVKASLAYIRRKKFTIPLAVKISPLPPGLLREIATVIIESKTVQAVTATNSYPNSALASGVGPNKTVPLFLAGMGGRALKPISLGVVQQLRTILPEAIDIIGCGGIYNSEDAQDYLAAGAKAVQIVSSLMDKGPGIFKKLS